MENLNEIGARIEELYNEFISNHEAHVTKGNKKASGRARKALGEIKKLVTEYRKLSIESNK